MITLWHNPRCSKSRAALKLLEAQGVQVKIRKYLEDQPSRDELETILRKLGLPASALIRTGEKTYRSLDLDQVESADALIDAMTEHPILIERPIAIHGDRAVIGRPPEDVLQLL